MFTFFLQVKGLQDNPEEMTPQQEESICAMVVADNAVRLQKIQRAVLKNDNIFENIQSISQSCLVDTELTDWRTVQAG